VEGNGIRDPAYCSHDQRRCMRGMILKRRSATSVLIISRWEWGREGLIERMKVLSRDMGEDGEVLTMDRSKHEDFIKF